MTWALATIAVLLVAYAAFSRRLQLMSVSGAMFFTTAGLLAGPVLGLLDLHLESEQVKLLAEITLTLVLFADASRISLRALRREFAVPLRLLGIGLPLTIVAGTLVGALVIPGVSVAEAAVLAVVLACTDAALGQAVVTDERIPSRIRQGLNVERSQRRALRPDLLHRDRCRRGRRRHGVGTHGHEPRARADRLRTAGRHPGRDRRGPRAA